MVGSVFFEMGPELTVVRRQKNAIEVAGVEYRFCRTIDIVCLFDSVFLRHPSPTKTELLLGSPHIAVIGMLHLGGWNANQFGSAKAAVFVALSRGTNSRCDCRSKIVQSASVNRIVREKTLT